MILHNKRITKALIRLRGCVGWSVPLLFANAEIRLLTFCLLLLPLWESVIVLCLLYFVLCPFWCRGHLDGEGAGCFAWFVFLVSRNG